MVGLGSGLWFWLVAALKGLGPVVAVVVGLMFGLILGLPVGLVYGVMSSATWSTTLAWLQLQASRHVLAVRLMPFLEDARDRGVLRTVGPIYQFRHAKLQDQLAN
jgi:membrane protein implicated in regulation of membrane protease activity